MGLQVSKVAFSVVLPMQVLMSMEAMNPSKHRQRYSPGMLVHWPPSQMSGVSSHSSISNRSTERLSLVCGKAGLTLNKPHWLFHHLNTSWDPASERILLCSYTHSCPPSWYSGSHSLHSWWCTRQYLQWFKWGDLNIDKDNRQQICFLSRSEVYIGSNRNPLHLPTQPCRSGVAW